MSRRNIAFSICLSLLVVGACATTQQEIRPAETNLATITAQAWRGTEYSWVRFAALDGQPLADTTEREPAPGADHAAQIPRGAAKIQVAPGPHQLTVRFYPVSFRRLADPVRVIPGWIDAPPSEHTISWEAAPGKTYVVRSRAWIRSDPDIPFGTFPEQIMNANLAVAPVAARCDIVWVVERKIWKSDKVVACATFPDGCLPCDASVPLMP
jgi:hypothetical protein